MPSQRHTSTGVLDAARDCVLAVGVRRTTLTDVARRAGVSRMTLYRRFADANALLRTLMTSEFVRVLRQAEHSARRERTARARLVATAVGAASGLRNEPLFRRVLDVDPELLLRYVVDGLGSTQLAALDQLSEVIAAGHTDGSIRQADTQELAHAVLLVVQPFVLSAATVAPTLDEPALDRELALVLDRYLAP